MADKIVRNLRQKTTVGPLICYRDGDIVNITGYTVGELSTSGMTIPELYRPNTDIRFTGKAYINGSDTWTQPFKIQPNGLLTARSNNDNSSVSVIWWGFNVTYIV